MSHGFNAPTQLGTIRPTVPTLRQRHALVSGPASVQGLFERLRVGVLAVIRRTWSPMGGTPRGYRGLQAGFCDYEEH